MTRKTPGSPAVPVKTATDLLNVTQDSWLAFFTAFPNLLPRDTWTGDVPTRTAAFVKNITKVLFVAVASGGAASGPTAAGIPTLSHDQTVDVLARFFNSYNNFLFTDAMDSTKLQAIRA